MTIEDIAAARLTNAVARTNGQVELFRCNTGLFRAMQGPGIVKGLPVGFPDYFGYITHRGVAYALAVETKSTDGRFREKQKQWREKLIAAGVIYRVARPEDAAEIIDELVMDIGQIVREMGTR